MKSYWNFFSPYRRSIDPTRPLENFLISFFGELRSTLGIFHSLDPIADERRCNQKILLTMMKEWKKRAGDKNIKKELNIIKKL